MIELVAKALTWKFSEDKTAPGVVVSQLRNGAWYASAVRYKKGWAKDKQIAFKAEGETIRSINELAKLIVSAPTNLKIR